MERVILANSFIFGSKGYIRLRKRNMKEEYRHIFFKIQKIVRFVACCLNDNF